jgi:hypothetical protein
MESLITRKGHPDVTKVKWLMDRLMDRKHATDEALDAAGKPLQRGVTQGDIRRKVSNTPHSEAELDFALVLLRAI